MSQELADWLPRQRWYGDKGRTISGLRTVESELALVAVHFRAGPPSLYQVADLETESNRQRWLQRLLGQERQAVHAGRLECELWVHPRTGGPSRLLGAEQSNTSVLYDSVAGAPSAVLKLFRRLQPGDNPEIEVPRALAPTSFRQLPQALGQARYFADGETYALASLQEFLPNRGDGWTYALERLAAGDALEAPLQSLGRRTAQLHAALAELPGSAFALEPVTVLDIERWRRRALTSLEAPALRPYGELLAPWRARLLAGAAGAETALGARLHRIHGDYHLGQVLRTLTEDWVVFDFEGEPARLMAERRRKGSPLQDVAGMLRSLSYAAYAARQPAWEPVARAAFLAGYDGIAGPLPEPAVRFFEMEKAVYELTYELAHRPDWVAVPLAGIRALLTESPC